MSLKRYQQKRDFKKSTEPKGKVAPSASKNLYIIQKHAASHLHYDFRIELNGVLKSWAVPKGPSLDPTIKRLAVHVEDHPIEYGSFEGIIPEGEYGGGTVMLWDQGTWIAEGDPVKAYQNGNLTFELKGTKLKGLWKLVQIKKTPKNWLLMKLKDKYARSQDNYDVTVTKAKSVVSNKTLKQITEHDPETWPTKKLSKKAKSITSSSKKKIKIFPKHNVIKRDNRQLKRIAMPTVNLQLSTLVDQPPQGDEWLHEIKLDGYRLLAYIENKKVKLITRGKHNWTEKFKDIADELKKLPVDSAIFDGEIVVLDEQHKSNFQLLQNSLKQKNATSFVYYIFDILYYNGYDLTTLKLIERKKILENLLVTVKSLFLRYNDHIIGSGFDVYKKTCELGLEGIISKNINSKYSQRRDRNWLKCKCTKRQEFVIGGFTKPQGSRSYFGALLLGFYQDSKLIYCGHVGTGFTEASLKTIYELLKKYQTNTMPFYQQPSRVSHATWVKPVLVAEIEYAEITRDLILRQPSFKGLRSDKNPKLITLESPITTKQATTTTKVSKKKSVDIGITITNPDRILYNEAKITKLELIEYYQFIHQWMLPYVVNRPLALLRCPEGYDKECFFQKHLNEMQIENLYTIDIKEKDDTEHCIYIKDLNGLLTLAQLGTLEIHPWGSSNNKIEQPDQITFDLDPAPDVPWKKVIAAAFEIKHQFEKLNLVSFVKSTGGKGLHVVIPIKPKYSWKDIKSFSHTFVKYMGTQFTDKYITDMAKHKRTGKIYLDYLRNQRGATAIAPYSTRALQQATIATPLAWDELTNDKRDITFNLKTIYNRMETLKHDPWKQFFNIKQSLNF